MLDKLLVLYRLLLLVLLLMGLDLTYERQDPYPYQRLDLAHEGMDLRFALDLHHHLDLELLLHLPLLMDVPLMDAPQPLLSSHPPLVPALAYG